VDQTSKPIHSIAWIKWLVFILLLMASLGVAFWLLPSASFSVQARIDALKKAGYPITPQDLAKMYPPLPDSENSVIIYQKAFSQYVAPPSNATNWPILSTSTSHFRSELLPTDVKQGISDYVNQNENTLALLHQAAGIEKGRYDSGLKNGFPNDARRPFMEINANAQVLALAVILRAEDRQPAATTELLLDSLGLPRSLEHEPGLVSHLKRDAFVGLSCSSLELALNKTAFSDDELRSLAAAFHEAETSDGLKQALICERCEGIWLRDMLVSNPFSRPNEPLDGKLRELYSRVFHYRDSDFILYLDMWEKLGAAIDLPYPRPLDVAKQLTSQMKESKENGRTFGVLFVEWDKSFLFDAKTHAQLLLSEAALAAERYRLANHNQLPATLQDLVPSFLGAVPADPFDGKPLRYNRLPKGYIIYSIGEDGVDNGGSEWNPDTKTGDLTFTVER
jgi:hypothetical protein